jgi:hypothetical protein
MKMSLNAAAIAVTVALLTACAPPAAKEDPAVAAMRAAADSQQQMLAAIATWVDAWDTGNTDGLDAITAAEFQRTAPDQNANGLDELKALIANVHTIYPDFNITNDASAAGPNGGFVQWTATGTDSGSENPTGNKINVTGISRYQFVDGKIVSEFVSFDSAALMSQLQREDIPHGAR